MYKFNKRQLAGFSCLIALLLLIAPTQILADSPEEAVAEKCIECHEDEVTAWLDSPHAAATGNNKTAATCEGCHGPYKRDHEESGNMKLVVDSSLCEECHTSTFEQWQNTTHAEAGVSCIGCHKSHSLQFRLTDGDHCGSCHTERRQDFGMSAHGLADVTCTDCHLSSNEVAAENVAFISTRTNESVQTPSHDFTSVSTEDCIKCHTEDAHEGLPDNSDAKHVAQARLASMASTVPQLTARLESSERTNQSLMLLTPAALGLGIALGAALGIGSVMLFCFVNQKKGAQQ